MTRSKVLLGVLVLCLFATFAVADTNVALGKPVSLNGGVFGVLRPGAPWPDATTYPLASASTITDGIFLTAGTEWQDGTIWWDTQAENSDHNPISSLDWISIDLQGSFNVSGLIIQGDDNDDYLVYGLDSSNVWQLLWDAPHAGSYGMQTRPDLNDNSVIYHLGSPVNISALAIVGGQDSDNYYSVSEVQAFVATPEPGSISLALFGIPAVVAAIRRRKK